MAKIDRLGWAAGITFRSHGVKIGIRVTDPGALDAVAARLPPGWKPATSPAVHELYSLKVGGAAERPGVRTYSLVYAGARRIARTLQMEEALEALEEALHFHVAVAAPSRIFVHAGVVGWKGVAIVIPGRSMSGKTSLVKALVEAGATYYSDEYAVFDSQGRVHAYPKPMSVREPDTAARVNVRVAEVGGRVGRKPLPVGMILSAPHRAGAHTRLKSQSPGEAAMILMDNTLMARYKPDVALAMFGHAVPDAITLSGVRGEADAAAKTVLRRIGAALRSPK